MIKIATLATALFAATTAMAEIGTYYSVDVEMDYLYKINVDTGAAYPVGPLLQNVDNVDLGYYNGTLFAKSEVFNNPPILWRIATTGQTAGWASNPVGFWGTWYNGGRVMSIAGAPYGLSATYESPSAPRIGGINIYTGQLFNGGNTQNYIIGMGYADGYYYQIAHYGQNGGYVMDKGTAFPFWTVGGDIWDPSGNANPMDLEKYSSNRLVSIGATGRYLVFIDRASANRTLVKQITGIAPSVKLEGLAFIPAATKNNDHSIH